MRVKELKVGDRLISRTLGHGVISSIAPSPLMYRIEVFFRNTNESMYTNAGPDEQLSEFRHWDPVKQIMPPPVYSDYKDETRVINSLPEEDADLE